MSDAYGYGGGMGGLSPAQLQQAQMQQAQMLQNGGSGAYYPFLPAASRAPLSYGASPQGGGETGPLGGTNDNALRQFLGQGGGGGGGSPLSPALAQALMASALRGGGSNMNITPWSQVANPYASLTPSSSLQGLPDFSGVTAG